MAVEMAATGAVGQRLDKLDESFLMALDYMIQQADRDDKVLACEILLRPFKLHGHTSLFCNACEFFLYTKSMVVELFNLTVCRPNWDLPLLELHITKCSWLICFLRTGLRHFLMTFLLQQRWLLEVIKDVVLAQLSQKFPSEVSVHMNFTCCVRLVS